MVNELIFRAADTATALEKVQTKLGEDAFIIGIKNVGSFVEITASIEPPKKRPVKNSRDAERWLKSAKTSLDDFRQQRQTSDLDADTTLDLSALSKAIEANSLTQTDELAPAKPVAARSDSAADGATDIQKDAEIGDLAPASLFDDVESKTAPISGPAPEETQADGATPLGFEEAAPANLPSEIKSAHVASLESNTPRLSFGDLLAIGLSSEFIKAEIKISEFEGAIEKDALLDRLVEIFIDPKAAELFQPRQNVVFIGPPGSGKSTLIAGLMQNISQQSSEKPQVLHVSEEVLFETDRLSFYARVLNFAQSRQKICSASNILAPQSQISEIAWEKHPEFCAVFKRDGQIFSHVHVVMVLPAELNTDSMDEILRVSPANLSVIFNKCDYGRASPKQLMSLYNRGGKVTALTGDPSLQSDLKAVDAQTLRIFFEYILPV
jgi:energy-coupling factor transporter ATP-binding protein EcfA2